jgi:hypothetical protein
VNYNEIPEPDEEYLSFAEYRMVIKDKDVTKYDVIYITQAMHMHLFESKIGIS